MRALEHAFLVRLCDTGALERRTQPESGCLDDRIRRAIHTPCHRLLFTRSIRRSQSGVSRRVEIDLDKHKGIIHSPKS